MRTKNELYQEALRTIAARRQTARALAEDARAEAEAVIPALRHAEEEVRVRGIRAGAKIHLQKVPGHWRGRRAHLQLCPQGDAGPPPERDRGAFQPVHFQL